MEYLKWQLLFYRSIDKSGKRSLWVNMGPCKRTQTAALQQAKFYLSAACLLQRRSTQAVVDEGKKVSCVLRRLVYYSTVGVNAPQFEFFYTVPINISFFSKNSKTIVKNLFDCSLQSLKPGAAPSYTPNKSSMVNFK